MKVIIYFFIRLLHNTSISNNNRLIINSNEIQVNINVYQENNNHHCYFIVNSHRENDYSNILFQPIERQNTCVVL